MRQYYKIQNIRTILIFTYCIVSFSQYTKHLNGIYYSIKHGQHDKYTNEGYFHIQRQKNDIIINPADLIVFGRIVGPVITELIFHHHHHNDNHLEAKYRLPSSGIYNASIELRYEHFDPNNYSSTPVFYTDNELLNVTITYVKDEHFSEEITDKDHWNFERSLLHGFWRSSIPYSIPAKMPFIDLEEDKNMTQFQNTRIKQLENALTFESRHYNNSLELLGSTIHKLPNSSSIFQEMCFIGDSQMRHLHEMVYALLSGHYEKFYSKGSRTDKSVTFSDTLHLIMDNYALMQFSEIENMWLGNCSTIVLDFGQWHISWATMSDLRRGPFTRIDYENLVNKTLQAYIDRIPATSKLYFLGTLAFGNSVRSYVPGRNDFRDDAVMRSLNAGGMEVCSYFHRQRVRCLNMFMMGTAVQDFSYDTYHFFAPVGPQMALALVYEMLHDELGEREPRRE